MTLRSIGLFVTASYRGRQVRYALADPHLATALRELVDVVLAVEPSPHCADDTPPATDPSGETVHVTEPAPTVRS